MGKKKSDDIFYGLILNEDQEKFKEALMDDNIQVVLCDATAGAGKTLLSVACAKIKVLGEQRYDSCCFVVPVNNEGVIGFRPGDTQAKTAEYFEPLHDSLYTIGEVPGRAIINDVSLKNGTGWIEARTPVFMRGINLANKYVILDECQNFTVQELKKIISRCHDSSKVVCIGCMAQCDIPISKSGFHHLIEYMRGYEGTWTQCSLKTSYRGRLAEYIDKL